MSDGNVQLSMTNLTQMDRFQADSHRSPMVNQDQNAQLARQEAARKATAPAAPDKSEGKIIDPSAKREEDARKKRKRRHKGGPDGDAAPAPPPNFSGGRIIDFKA